MAKIEMTRMNFTKELVEKAEPFLKMLMKGAGADLSEMPAEQTVTIDTDKIICVDAPLGGTLGHGAFTVHFVGRNDPMYFKESEYRHLLDVWNKKEKELV